MILFKNEVQCDRNSRTTKHNLQRKKQNTTGHKPVGFIEHYIGNTLHVQIVVRDEVVQSSGCGDNNFHPLADGLNLVPPARSSVDADAPYVAVLVLVHL